MHDMPSMVWIGVALLCIACAWWLSKKRPEISHQAHCEYAITPKEVRCYRDQVGALGPCRNCNNGRPRFVTKAEVARREKDIADGWLKPDGQLCDRDTYIEAVTRQITPAQVLAGRGQPGPSS
jgi:hypothetical protein